MPIAREGLLAVGGPQETGQGTRGSRTSTMALLTSLPMDERDGRRYSFRRQLVSDVWVYEIPHGTLTRLTFDEHSTAPVWSPDGKRIAFATTRPNRTSDSREILPTGAAPRKPSFPGVCHILAPASWSSDGKFLAYWTVGSETGRDVWIAPLTGEGKRQPCLQTKFNEMQARLLTGRAVGCVLCRKSRAVMKFTCNPSRVLAVNGRFQPTAARCRCGRRMAANCSI